MRGASIVSSSANADRDEERNANPAGWPATEAPVECRRWPPPLKASRGAFVPEKNPARRHRTGA